MYNIVLTPETPEYPGSEWYAETMSNERIIAACFCCFSEENITQGTVEFRECVKSSVEYVEGDKPGLNLVYGIFQDQTQELEILQQHVGQVEITLGADMHTSGITQRVESCISANSGSKVAPQLGSCSHVGETTQDFELVSMSTWKSEIKRADGERARADIEMVKAIRIRNRMIKQAKRIKRGNVAYLKMKASLQSLYETEKMRADNEATRVHGLEKDLESVRENGKTSQSGTDDHEEVAKKRRRTV
ncbi:hypothetical protein LPJ53_002380 [Coemansia erecta]|uniref:DUF4246 domain-containing protein n=1 Tax=Coemansia erecta TaxID=147472 RepID=A0A9W8CTX5_9FUNG|nr:hypothetical protein LPJ53_002380 [Coemansia erecta]